MLITTKRMFNSLLAIVAATFMNAAYADIDYGFYIGGDIGGARAGLNEDQIGLALSLPRTFEVHQDVKTRALGRAYIGYQFNEYVGTELGYNYIQSTPVTITNPQAVTIVTVSGSPPVTTTTYKSSTANGKTRQQALDLVLVGTLPLDYGVGIFGKLGVAYLVSKLNYQSQTIDDKSVVPTYGIGMNYDYDAFRFKIGYNRINKHKNERTINFAYFGVAYYFDAT